MTCTVLLVDDQPDAADSMAMLLELSGCEVRTAYSAHEALRLVRSRVPDIVLLDLALPDLSGFDLARCMLRDVPALGPRLAALSGFSLPRDRERAFQAGFSRYFLKPVDPDEVVEWIRGVGSPVQSSGSTTLR